MFTLRDLGQINENAEMWGGKATALYKIIKNGFNVPVGFVISSEAYSNFYMDHKDCKEFIEVFEKWIDRYFNKDDEIIFRSSANIENDSRYAACGVFDSVLVSDRNKLEQSLFEVWKSVNSKYSNAYCKTIKLSKDRIKMAVIVQKVERKRYSAVIQSYDIVNDRNIIVVEYISGGVNSIVDGKHDAKVLYIDSHGTVIDGERNNDIPNDILGKIISDIKRIEAICGGHVEIEAQIDSLSIVYLQVRKIFEE